MGFFFTLIYVVIVGVIAWAFFSNSEKKRKAFHKKLNGALQEEHAPLQIEIGGKHKHALISDEAVYWYFDRLSHEYGTNTWSKKHALYQHLLERLQPDDVLAMARSGIEKNIPAQKTVDVKLLTSLNKLAKRKEWRHLSFVSPPVSAVIQIKWTQDKYPDLAESYFVGTLRGAAHAQPRFQSLYCEKHYHRFIKMYSKEIDYWVCRKCNGTQHGIIATRSILVLSRSVSWVTRREGGYFWVNGLLLEEPCDFDEISVGDCSYDDLQRFCIMIGNDTDTRRMKQYPDIYYKLRPNVTVSPEGIALLNRFFAQL